MAEPALRLSATTVDRELPYGSELLAITELAVGARFVLRGQEQLIFSLSRAVDLDLGQTINRASSRGPRAALRLGPDEWLLIAPAAAAVELAQRITAAAGTHAFALVDVGHRSVALRLAGVAVEDVLASGCPLPLGLAHCALDRCTRTVFAKAEIVLWRRHAHEFQLEVPRSYAPYVLALLQRELAAL